MEDNHDMLPTTVIHWNYRGFTEFPLKHLNGEEFEVTDIYLKENLISRVPREIVRLENLESLYLSGNDISELPREISKLRYLKCLDVSGNRLKSIPDEIGEVRNLKFLILDENELSELPTRLVELRALRYLSVCDNKLRWLPQRPVYNYHHCELRFWRNIHLKAIPYSLWYHMFRNQQTRSLNIGCLKIPTHQCTSQNNRCRLKLTKDSREWEFDVDCPPNYRNIQENYYSPPSLLEMCKRLVYILINDAANRLTNSEFDSPINSISRQNYNNLNDRIYDLESNFEEFNLNNGSVSEYDVNGNNCKIKQPLTRRNDPTNKIRRNKRGYYVPADVVKEYLNFLPTFLKLDLCNGPISKCENVCCKNPIFDYTYYEFCFGKIILIDNSEDIILSAAFCSKYCANKWKMEKTNIIPWSLIVK